MGKAMKQQISMQKETMKDMDLDQMEDLRDEMEEMNAEVQYMNEAMNRNYDIDVDENELD